MARNKQRIPVIGVTGSAGKSTTTAFINSILKTKWTKIMKTPGNRNLPKHTKEMVNKIRPYHKAVILEMGLGRAAGKYHFNHIKPTIGVITNVGTAHYGRLGNSISATAKKKSAMIKYMNPKGILLLNNDDPNSKLLTTHLFKGYLVTVGIKNKAHYQGRNIKYERNGMSFQVYLNNRLESFFIPTFGEHNVINALFAVAIARKLGFSPHEIRRGLKNFKPPSRRLRVINLPENSTLIDDTFNANPQSVKAATDVLVNLGIGKQKIAVIGSMLELGSYTKKGHSEVGKYLANKGVHRIFTLGEKAEGIKKGAIASGFPRRNIHSFKNRSSLHRLLKYHITPNIVILVKGSHRMYMKETSEYIANYSLRNQKRK
ncbi:MULTISPECIES: UDP-N-acetylmuramoyl-tripeptide--D-alanyl-D-alanine ligase [Bacillaceae]|uniref:UDP-N-acetylmuramoyl-tripeptide--D-alanyl-D-alanine ligase n=1 Tax=Evansella alkalicola TaxID=745819 RepID=A0ABS6JZV9_9BACI|nr:MULTISPECIES: UDP-N-acetylmuramoyl-tripeptide--D-alanyl-D-alanine ligase [Bacillaceae]MBU9723616.1 UDP-N-acetylmuramoyl-tripeptide--D-alanyl-D-alanine ligase [Bacillus alkalicola]